MLNIPFKIIIGEIERCLIELLFRNKYIYPIKRTFDSAHKDNHEDFKRIQQTKRMVLAEEEVC